MTSKSNQKIITIILLILIFISSFYFIKLIQERTTIQNIPDIRYGYPNNPNPKSIKKAPLNKKHISNDPKKKTTLLLDINKADKEALMTLPGIGNVLATRIIEYREINGEFKNNKELQKVSGIGEKKFKNILPKLQTDKIINLNGQKEKTSSKVIYCSNCHAKLIPDNNRRKTMKPYCRKCLKYLGKQTIN